MVFTCNRHFIQVWKLFFSFFSVDFRRLSAVCGPCGYLTLRFVFFWYFSSVLFHVTKVKIFLLRLMFVCYVLWMLHQTFNKALIWQSGLLIFFWNFFSHFWRKMTDALKIGWMWERSGRVIKAPRAGFNMTVGRPTLFYFLIPDVTKQCRQSFVVEFEAPI